MIINPYSYAAASIVAETDAANVGGGGVTTSAIDTAGANLIVIATGISGAISDSKGNTYTQITAGDPGCRLWYCANPTVGSGHTFTIDGTSNFSPIAVQAFAGAHASPLDNNTVNSAVGTTVQPGSITPSVNNCLLVAAMSNPSAALTTTSIDSGFTQTCDRGFVGSNSYGIAMGYLSQTTAGAVNPTFTVNASSTNVAAMAAFKHS